LGELVSVSGEMGQEEFSTASSLLEMEVSMEDMVLRRALMLLTALRAC
jgi:hypothetical protein